FKIAPNFERTCCHGSPLGKCSGHLSGYGRIRQRPGVDGHKTAQKAVRRINERMSRRFCGIRGGLRAIRVICGRRLVADAQETVVAANAVNASFAAGAAAAEAATAKSTVAVNGSR